MPYVFMEVAVFIVFVFVLYKAYTRLVYPIVDRWFKPAEPRQLRKQIDSAKAEAELLRSKTEKDINRKLEVQKQLEELTGTPPEHKAQ